MVSRRRFLVLAGSVGAVGVAAVTAPALLGGADDEGPRLPSIRYGGESCAHCGMLIDDDRFAAAWVAGRNEVHFDDVGCLVKEADERPAPADAQFYVTTYEAGSWVKADEASYVLSPEIRSPMAYGIAAASTPADAERLARELEGSTHDWHALPAHLGEGQH